MWDGRAPGFVVDEVGDTGLLFDSAGQKLYSIAVDEARAWGAISRGEVDDAAGAPKAAKSASGLSRHMCDERDAAGPRLDANDPAPDVAPTSPQPSRRDEQHDAVFSVAGLQFGVAFADAAVGRAVRSVIGHLEAPRGSPDVVLTSIRSGGRYTLISGDNSLCCATPDGVAVNLKNEILEHWLMANPASFAIHGACLGDGEDATILAGRSGSGKTTIAALLHARGAPLVADDVTLIDERRANVGGFPFAFALKSGSWPVLAAAYPDLRDIAERRRPDGRVVRYLPPRRLAAHGRVGRLVFPTYVPGAGVRLEPLPGVDALVHLLSEARNHHRRLSVAGFRRLCALVRDAEVVALTFGQAENAAEALDARRAAAS